VFGRVLFLRGSIFERGAAAAQEAKSEKRKATTTRVERERGEKTDVLKNGRKKHKRKWVCRGMEDDDTRATTTATEKRKHTV